MTATAKPIETSAPPAGAADRLERIPLDQIHESKLNPRTRYDPEALAQLKDSLLASGQLEPVLVRPMLPGSRPKGPASAGYELAAGHRRYRAANLACEQNAEGATYRGLHHLLAIVRDMDDRTFVETLNIDNLQRDDLHPLEEAQGFRDLMTECGYDVKKIAARIGKSDRYVYDSLTLLKLIPEARKLFLAGRFERGHAIELARLSPEWQKEAINPDDAGSGYEVTGLWELEIADADPLAPEQERLALDEEVVVKACSVRELKTWIDDNVRATPETIDPFLFPDSAQLLAQAQTRKGRAARIVHITYDYRVPDAARDAKIKTYGSEAWQRADGKFKSKPCDYAQPGLVAAGPGRNDAFLVCVNKEKCAVHWRDWQRERERRVKERAAQDRRTAKGQKAEAAEPAKPAKPDPSMPTGKFHDQVREEFLARLVAEGLDAIKKLMASITLPDDVAWNLAHTDIERQGDWAKVGKRPVWRGGYDSLEEDLENALRDAKLPGKWSRRQPQDATAARADFACTIHLWRDREGMGLDAQLEKEIARRWKLELKDQAKKAKASAKSPTSARPAKKGKTKKAKKGKKR